MKTSIVICPFSLFGSPGASEGATLLGDALRELLADNKRERRPTRSRSYQSHVRINELQFGDLAAIGDWHARAHNAAQQALSAGDFLIWIGGNHLSLLPVYEALGSIEHSLVVQFDAHLDIYNLSDNPAELNHGNFLRHAEKLPQLVNLGHRDLFLTERSIRQYYRHAFSMPLLAIESAAALATVRETEASASRVFIDIDCDVLDPAYFPATAHPLPFGMTPPELLRFIDACWSDMVCGVSLSEFDAGRDRDDRSLSTLIWLLEYLLLKRYE